MTVRIMTVCTGNICRSPYAELLLAHRLQEVRPGAFEVASVGTAALVDHAVDPGTARILEARGVSHDTFAARQITEQLLADVDIVLPLTVEHRKTVLSYAPRLLKWCYTLKEMARLIEAADAEQPWTERLAGLETPEERWAQIPAHLTRQRGRSRTAEGVDDVADPYRLGDEAFDTMAADIDPAIERIVALEASFR